MSNSSQIPEIHRAKWVLSVSSPILRDGAVLARRGRVVAVGPFSSIRKDSPPGSKVVDHGEAALMPALVNAHTHLEISSIKGKIPFPQPGFKEWLELLFSHRAAADEKATGEGMLQGKAEMLYGGTTLCADITNGWAANEEERYGFPILERIIFLELLGFNLDSILAASPLQLGGNESPKFIPVPHSVYSVSPAIIAESKEWSRSRGLPFSMHVAEHADEMEFMRSGRGFCRELLERLERWDPRWIAPGKTPLQYLNGLGVLDPLTHLIHAVHMTDEDWALVAGKGCTVVFCPRSNRNMGSGRPEIEKALSLGINCALGTDSLASNTDLSLFAEAGFVLDEYPSIDPRAVLEMITLNPARSLGRGGDFGKIEPGSKASILAVRTGARVKESELAAALIESGKEGALEWVSFAQS